MRGAVVDGDVRAPRWLTQAVTVAIDHHRRLPDQRARADDGRADRRVSMLAGRALAPAGQIVGLLMQYQGARTAIEQRSSKIMAKPVERPAGDNFIHRPQLRGDIEFRNVQLRLPEPQGLGARGHQLQDRRRRARGADRPRRLGQVDHPAPDHGPVPAHRRRGAARRHRPAPARPGRRAPQPRLRVAGRDAVLRLAAREHHASACPTPTTPPCSPRPRSPA